MDPDEISHAGYVEKFEIHDAEDVKEVGFIGSSGTVAVDITDETMWEFIVIAYEVKERIEIHTEAMRELFESFEEK